MNHARRISFGKFNTARGTKEFSHALILAC